MWMVIRDSLRVNANALAFSKWSRNPSTFQQATLNAAWNSLVWMRIRCMQRLIITIVRLLFEHIASDLLNDTQVYSLFIAFICRRFIRWCECIFRFLKIKIFSNLWICVLIWNICKNFFNIFCTKFWIKIFFFSNILISKFTSKI